MIPIKDKNPAARPPVVTIIIIVLNVVIFVFELLMGDNVEGLFYQFGVVPQNITSSITSFSFSPSVFISPFSSMFLHGGVLHLGGNMLFLWVFGDNVEDKLGHGRYIVFYLVCGLTATLAHIIIAPNSEIPTIGASGAISGVLGAYMLMFPGARVVTIIPIVVFLQVVELPALVVLGIWFVLQFFNGIAALGPETAGMGGVAWWAHIGGFLAGLALVVPFRKFR